SSVLACSGAWASASPCDVAMSRKSGRIKRRGLSRSTCRAYRSAARNGNRAGVRAHATALGGRADPRYGRRMIRAKILGLGSYVPDRVVKNEEIPYLDKDHVRQDAVQTQ